jgi:multidrug resistance efflux pump
MRDVVRTRVLPWLVWCATIAAAGWLWADVRRDGALAFALAAEYAVAPPQLGRVAELHVAPGQRVAAGQVVATLDARAIDAEQAILAAERRRLEAELGAVRVATTARTDETARELDESVEAADLALKTARVDRQVRAAELAALDSRVDALRRLVADKMADRRELDAVLVEQAALAKQLQAADSLIEQQVRRATAARARRDALPADATELALEPVRKQLEVLAGREQLLAVRRAETVLRAPADGEVAEVRVRPGEVAAAGAPVVTIVGDQATREVQVCVREADAARVEPGEAVRLRSRDARATLQAHVTRLSPAIIELPPRCRRDPEVVEWGRLIAVALDEPTALLPGQAFSATFLGERSPMSYQTAPIEHVVTDSSEQPRPLLVPPALSARSRFEPSALAWLPRLGRYVVASDDTGHARVDDHAPWLFTLAGDGRVDPEPLVIAGLAELSDVEALAPGPGDSLYVLASQSPSRKGKRPPARQIFARITVADGAAKVAAATLLAERLSSAPQLLADLGVSDTAALDIEGMTATAAGGLLLGLKAPLDPDGRASIWHLPRPDVLLTGDLAGSGLTCRGAVPLTVAADGGQRPGGVSELLELPDGSLLVATTASGADPATQDGAVWHVRPGDLASARPLRVFPGLKPEGLALRPDGAAVVVVFDTGDAPPQWLELPRPQ